MNARARMIVAAIAAALLSTAAIVARAEDPPKFSPDEIAKLVTFETQFNKMMNDAIRGGNAETAFATNRCYTDIALDRIYQTSVRVPKPGGKTCLLKPLSRPVQKKLRDVVIRQLDAYYVDPALMPEAQKF